MQLKKIKRNKIGFFMKKLKNLRKKLKNRLLRKYVLSNIQLSFCTLKYREKRKIRISRRKSDVKNTDF